MLACWPAVSCQLLLQRHQSPLRVGIEVEAAFVEALEGTELPGGRSTQSYVGLPCLFAMLIQPGMDAIVVGGRLALVDGAGLGQDEGELASLCFVAVLVLELGRGAPDGNVEGLVCHLPPASGSLLEADPDLVNLAARMEINVLDNAPGTVD